MQSKLWEGKNNFSLIKSNPILQNYRKNIFINYEIIRIDILKTLDDLNYRKISFS
jgi:hypothetical protein